MKSAVASDVEPEPIDATILFADMIDSSLLSHVCRPSEYDDLVNEFQETAADVVAETVTQEQFSSCHPHVEVSVRGDELCLILGCTKSANGERVPKCHPNRCAWTALQVAIRLKRRWLLSEANKKRIDNGQPPLGIAIGIHAGPVIVRKHRRFPSGRTTLPANPQEISTAEGYAINIAKRVETASRTGRSSRIFLTRPIYNRTPSDFRLAFVRMEPPEFKGIPVAPVTYEAKGIGHFDDKCFPNSPELNGEGLKYCETVVAAQPDEIWLLLDLAHWYFDKGRYEDAANKYKAVIEVDASFAPAHMYLGRSQFRSYRIPEARAALERSWQLDPAQVRANHFLAVCLRREALMALYDHRPDLARDLFERSIELHQAAFRIAKLEGMDYPWAENGLIWTVAQSYELEDSEGQVVGRHYRSIVRPFSLDVALEKSIALVDSATSTGSVKRKKHLFLHTQAVVLLQQKEYDKALAALKEALAALERRKRAEGISLDKKAYAEKRAEMLFHRGRCKLGLRREREARRDWGRAVDSLLAPWILPEDQQRVLAAQYWTKFPEVDDYLQRCPRISGDGAESSGERPPKSSV